MLNDLYNADFVETGSELIALLHESEELKKHKPQYNKQRISENFTHCIDTFKDENGILNLKIIETDKSQNTLLSFVNYSSARERLDQWIEDHTLCLKYCNLTSYDSICDHHHIKKCYGICADKEDIETYNKRVHKILNQFKFPHTSFMVIDRGRNFEERSVILVENGKYFGYGYIDNSSQFNSPSEIKEIIKQTRWYPDANDLVRSFIRLNGGKIKVVEV